MPQFECCCGTRISLTESPSPYQGELLWENEIDSYQEKVYQDIKGFLKAAIAGKRIQWVEDNFRWGHLKEVEDAQVLFHIVSANKKSLRVIQCPDCRRVY